MGLHPAPDRMGVYDSCCLVLSGLHWEWKGCISREPFIGRLEADERESQYLLNLCSWMFRCPHRDEKMCRRPKRSRGQTCDVCRTLIFESGRLGVRYVIAASEQSF